jgi:hypothetical protein
MKTITAAELNTHLGDYLKLARAEEIIIQLDDDKLLRLGSVDPDDLLDEALENDPRFMQLIEARRQSYRQHGGIPLEAVRESVLSELKASGRQIHEEGLPYSADEESAEVSDKDNHAQKD